jgi:hypothetical protein
LIVKSLTWGNVALTACRALASAGYFSGKGADMEEHGDTADREGGQEPEPQQPAPPQPAPPQPAPPPLYVLQQPRRSKSPIVLTGIGGLVLGLVIGYGAGHGSKTAATSATVVTATTSAPSANSPSPAHTTAGGSSASSSSAAPAAPAKIGGSIALTGMNGDEKLTVTLVKVADPAKGDDEFSQPAAGKRWVAVQIRITDTAGAAYSDSPSNGAKLIDAQGQQYDDTFGNTTLGPAMDGSVKLAPGQSTLGVIVFEVPADAKATTFQFSLDSGFADQTGQWQLS